MNDLINRAYDLHVHSAPDILPRKMDDIEMAGRIAGSGMAGYMIKSHYFCTSERAELINKMFPKCRALGSITLNSSVGGINPLAVEMAARSGIKLVWFPTCDSKHEQAHVFGAGAGEKLPYWASILLQLKKDGVKTPVYSVLGSDGKLTREAIDTIDVIAKYNIILATGHVSHEEAFALVKTANERGVKRIIITHVDFPTTFYSIDEQKEFVKMGAYVEHCYTTYATGKVDFDITKEQIFAVGADRVILATDLGQKTAVYPDEGLLDFAQRMLKAGMSEKDVRKMIVDNPVSLIG